MRISVFYLASLLATIDALTITSPSDGQTLDPTEPITFSWTSDSSDPDTFDILLDDSAVGGLVSNLKVASGVSTSAGSYILPTGATKTYGDGFVLKAQSSSGDILATSPQFTLSMGDGSSPTYTGTVSEGPASTTDAAAASSTATGDDAATSDNGSTTTGTSDAQATLGGNSNSAAASGTAASTGSNSFTTSTVSRSGSSTGTSSSSSPSATISQNAQPKLGSSSQIAFTAAGLIAGLAALLA